MSERTAPPAQLVAGTTYVYRRVLDDYPAGTWTLTLLLRGPAPATLDVVAVADGTEHVVTITATASATLAAGAYKAFEQVHRGAGAGLERYQISESDLVLSPNPVTAAAGDLQSHRTRMIALYKTELQARAAAGDIESYQAGAGDTAVTRRPTQEIEQELRRLEAEEAAYQRGGVFQSVSMPVARRGRMA
jgi:hypothetical protein